MKERRETSQGGRAQLTPYDVSIGGDWGRWTRPCATVSTLARLDVDASSVSSEPPAAAVADPGAFVALVVSEGLEVYLPLSGIVDPKKAREHTIPHTPSLARTCPTAHINQPIHA